MLVPTLFEDSDLSALPSADPGSGKPWVDPTSRAVIVGALGTMGLTQAAANLLYAAISHTHTIANVINLQSALDGKVNDTGDTITGPLTVSQGTGVSTLQVINDGNNGAGTALCVGAPSYGFQVNGANYDAWAIARFSTVVPLTIRGAASQTADLQRWQNSAGTTLAYVNSGGSFVSGSTALNYSAAGVKLGGTADIEFAPTNIDGTTDALIVRNATGQVDLRADNGLRLRNFANNADGPLSCSQVTVSSSVLPSAAGGAAVGSTTSMFSNIVQRGDYLNYNAANSGTTNYERGYMRWASNEFQIGNERGGTGSLRFNKYVANAHVFMVGGQSAWEFSQNGNLTPGTTTRDIGSFSLPIQNLYFGPAGAMYALNVGANGTNYERGYARWNSNFFEIGTEQAGTGVARDLRLVRGGTTALTISASSAATFAGAVFLGAFTVATLPSASASAGAFAQVTDANSTTNGTTAAGGGSNRVPVFSNGTNWIIK